MPMFFAIDCVPKFASVEFEAVTEMANGAALRRGVVAASPTRSAWYSPTMASRSQNAST